jgi:hypothetical protein
LGGGGGAFGAAEVEDFFGVVVEHRQVVPGGGGLPCVFRTADFASIYAASCEFMYSMRTSCGVR